MNLDSVNIRRPCSTAGEILRFLSKDLTEQKEVLMRERPNTAMALVRSGYQRFAIPTDIYDQSLQPRGKREPPRCVRRGHFSRETLRDRIATLYHSYFNSDNGIVAVKSPNKGDPYAEFGGVKWRPLADATTVLRLR